MKKNIMFELLDKHGTLGAWGFEVESSFFPQVRATVEEAMKVLGETPGVRPIDVTVMLESDFEGGEENESEAKG